MVSSIVAVGWLVGSSKIEKRGWLLVGCWLVVGWLLVGC